MGLIAALSGLVVRALGRIATAAFGWASTLLFGRQPRDRELVLSAIAIASLAWVAAVVGVVRPDLGTAMIALLPLADLVPEDVARLVMLALAAVLPAAVGFALATVGTPGGGIRARLAAVARGYLVTPLLAAVVAWLAAYGVYRRVRFAMSGWTQVHLPLVIPDGRTDEVAAVAVAALRDAGLEVTRGEPDGAVGRPAAWLARAAGRPRQGGAIGRAVVLRSPGLEVALYPFDAAMAGSREAVARARAALALRLSASPAHLTMAPESQQLEDAIAAARSAGPVARAAALRSIDARLATEPHEPSDWDVLARLRFAAEVAGDELEAGLLAEPRTVGREMVQDAAPRRGELPWLAAAAVATVANALLVLGPAAARLAEATGRTAGRVGRG